MNNKFKIGDEVVAISTSLGWGNAQKGDIGIITSMDGTGMKAGMRVDFPHYKGWNCLGENIIHKENPVYITHEDYLKLKK